MSSDVTVDQLVIEISSSVTPDANKNLDDLAKSLSTLASGVDRISTAKLAQIRETLSGWKVGTTLGKNLKSVATGISELNRSSRGFSDGQTRTMREYLRMLGSAAFPSVKGFSTLGNGLSKVVDASRGFTDADALAVSTMADAVGRFNGIKISGMGTLGKGLGDIVQVARSFRPEDSEQVLNFAKALTTFEAPPDSKNVSGFLRELAKLPKSMGELDKIDLAKLETRMQGLAKAMKPLADTMSKVSAGFSALPPRVMKMIQDAGNPRGGNSRRNGVANYGRGHFNWRNIPLVVDLYNLSTWVEKATNTLGRWAENSNSYVENLNLFAVAMGKATTKAKAFAEQAQEVLGIDASEFMRFQGIFRSITGGFGIAEEKANLMSKNLTQVAYDLSSLFNIDIQTSMLKVQSGISGELEPLRSLGFALDQATLSHIALNYGITQSLDTMTQAQKAQLRYIAIMEQSKNAHYDFARTLMSPANAIRVLQQQFNLLARSLGNIVIPILQAVIPWVQAAVKMLTGLFNSIARLLGFRMPEFNPVPNTKSVEMGSAALGGLADQFGNVGDSAGRAKKAVDEYKATVMGFDQLNILNDVNDKTSLGAGGGGLGVPGYDGGALDLPIDLSAFDYNFLDGAQRMADDAYRSLEKFVGGIREWLPAITGLAAAIGTVYAVFKLRSWIEAIQDPANALRRLASSLKWLVTTPIGRITLLVSALTGLFVYLSQDFKYRALQNLDERLGKVRLSAAEVEKVVKDALDRADTMHINSYMVSREAAESAQRSLKDAITALDGSLYRIGIGIDVDAEIMINQVTAVGTEFRNVIETEFERENRLLDSMDAGGVDVTKLRDFANERHNTVSQMIVDTLAPKEAELIKAIREKASPEVIHNIAKELAAIRQQILEEYEALSRNTDFSSGITNAVLGGGLEKFDRETWNAVAEEGKKQLAERSQAAARYYNESQAEWQEAYAKNKITREEYLKGMREVEDSYYNKLAAEGPLELQNLAFKGLKQHAFNEEYKKADFNVVKGVTHPFAHSQTLPWNATMQWENIAKYKIGKPLQESANMSDVDQRALLEALKPYEYLLAGLTDIADRALQSGIKIPENVRAGLTDHYQMLALAGDTRGMLYMLGQELTNSDDFYQLLSDTNAVGASMPKEMAQGFLFNLPELKYVLKDGVLQLQDAAGEVKATVTPLFVQNMRQMGYDIIPAVLESFGLVAEKGKDGVWRFSEETEKALLESQPELLRLFGDLGFQLGDKTKEELAKTDLSGTGKAVVADAHNEMQNYADSNPVNFQVNAEAHVNFEVSTTGLGRVADILAEAAQRKSYSASISVRSDGGSGNRYSTYANGGFPQEGELFLAREPGNPELVGRIGNRTAVANNDQIVQAIEQGVYRAMTAAGGNQGGGDLVVVVRNPNEVTGREIGRINLKQAKREGYATV